VHVKGRLGRAGGNHDGLDALAQRSDQAHDVVGHAALAGPDTAAHERDA
jgi:hypothetical protein